jgi:hypothetical protein
MQQRLRQRTDVADQPAVGRRPELFTVVAGDDERRRSRQVLLTPVDELGDPVGRILDRGLVQRAIVLGVVGRSLVGCEVL